MHGIDWLANKEDYLNKVKGTETDQEFLNTIDEILRDINNGHTHILDRDYVKRLRKAYYYSTKDLPANWRVLLFETLNSELVKNCYNLVLNWRNNWWGRYWP
ncbi:hypothetical protein V2B37_08250 [Natranaerobius thermophilus JW/NM-WN-LF]|nr:hypothetical protein [Natranaerobius thermophilus]